MNSLAQLWRTTTVRLTALFVLIFVVFSVLLLAFISWQSSIQIQRQQTGDIDREVAPAAAHRPRARLARGGVVAVGRLAAAAGAGHLLSRGAQRADDGLATSTSSRSRSCRRRASTASTTTGRGRRSTPMTGEDGPPQGYALVRSVVLESGMRLMVGRDVVERRGFTGIIVQGFVLGVLGIVAVRR